jgi:hypothetical protein
MDWRPAHNWKMPLRTAVNEGEGKKPEVEPSFTDLLFPEVLHFKGSETYLFRESIISAETDEIALTGKHVNDGELPKKGANGRIALADLVSRFDRGRYIVIVAELETDDRMCNPGRTPIVHEEVNTPGLGRGTLPS